jgi:hypothetical protein
LVSGGINFLALAGWRTVTFTTEGTWDSPEAFARFIQEQQITSVLFGLCLICCGTQVVSGAIGLVASWDFRSVISLSPAVRSRLEKAAIWISIPCLLTLFTNWTNGTASRGWETGPGVVYGILALAILLVGWVSGGRRIRMGGAVAIAMLALAGVIAALTSGFSGSPEPRGWVIALALSVIQALLAVVLALSRTPPEEDWAE